APRSQHRQSAHRRAPRSRFVVCTLSSSRPRGHDHGAKRFPDSLELEDRDGGFNHSGPAAGYTGLRTSRGSCVDIPNHEAESMMTKLGKAVSLAMVAGLLTGLAAWRVVPVRGDEVPKQAKETSAKAAKPAPAKAETDNP